jgi:hypothetical protein
MSRVLNSGSLSDSFFRALVNLTMRTYGCITVGGHVGDFPDLDVDPWVLWQLRGHFPEVAFD